MDRLENEIIKRISELKKIIEEAEKYASIPEYGEIRISRKGNSNQYYLRTEEICKKNSNGKYIKRKDKKIAVDIIQRDYCKELLSEAYEQLKALEKAKEVLEKNGLSEAYIKQNDYRKETIVPVYVSSMQRDVVALT